MERIENNGNGNLEKKVENILISKMQIVYGIIVVMVPVIAFFFKIQLDVELIKQNHEAHIETIISQIKDIQTDMKANYAEHDKLLDKYETINSKLDQLIGAVGK